MSAPVLRNDQRVAAFQFHLIVPFRLWHSPEARENHKNVFEHSEALLENTSSAWQKKPLPAQPSAGAAPDEAACKAYQAYSYFHPFVRQFWYANTHLHRYQRTDIRRCRFTSRDNSTDSFTLAVEQCELLLFNVAYVGLLHLVLSYPGADTNAQALDLADVQRIQNELRRIYPPYFTAYNGQYRGGHYPRRIEFLGASDTAPITAGGIDSEENIRKLLYESFRFRSDSHPGSSTYPLPLSYPWDKHWSTLLEPFESRRPPDHQDADTIFAVQTGDDRAAIGSYIAIEGDQPDMESATETLRSIDPGNWVRLCFADAPTSNQAKDRFPYSKTALKKFEDDYCYDRWWYQPGESSDAPSRILNCGYAFSWVGNTRDGYFSNAQDGAKFTFEHIYMPMAMIAHFQKTALLSASAHLSELKLPEQRTAEEQYRKDFDRFYRNFLCFTQIYWFDEITPQIQGIELFSMWHKHLGIKELYCEVRQELQDTVEYLEMKEAGKQTEEARKQTKKAEHLNQIAMVFSFLSLAMSLFGMEQVKAIAGLNVQALSLQVCLITLGVGVWILAIVIGFRAYLRLHKTS